MSQATIVRGVRDDRGGQVARPMKASSGAGSWNGEDSAGTGRPRATSARSPSSCPRRGRLRAVVGRFAVETRVGGPRVSSPCSTDRGRAICRPTPPLITDRRRPRVA